MDYEAFLVILVDGLERLPLRMLAYCLMPNHWHLVVQVGRGSELSAYMRWITGTHVRRYHTAHETVGLGHVYQGRYRNCLVQSDVHLLNVIRYVEANALRAKLVESAQDWPWSSLSRRRTIDGRDFLSESPVPRPAEWVDLVNHPEPRLEQIRSAICRGHPFGEQKFVERAVREHGLQHTVRRPGRAGRYTEGWDSHQLSAEADNW